MLYSEGVRTSYSSGGFGSTVPEAAAEELERKDGETQAGEARAT